MSTLTPTSNATSSRRNPRAITEGLRQECDPSIRVTTISPGVVTSELADSITEPGAAQAMRAYRAHAIAPEAIAAAVSYAVEQPAEFDVNENHRATDPAAVTTPPHMGELLQMLEEMRVRSSPGQALVVYHADPGTPGSQALALLGSLAATARHDS